MHRPVVVPLDGSALAEEALPLARAVAARLGAPLQLVRVHEPATTLLARVSDGHTVAGYEDRRLRASSTRYLEELRAPLAAELGEDGVSTALLDGPVGEALSGYVQAERARLVVMTTDERGVLGRRLFGSVTDYVLRWSGIPVLLTGRVGQGAAGDGDARFERILVALEGPEAGAEVLEHALELGGREGASYVLARSVPPGAAPGVAEIPVADSNQLSWAREMAADALLDLGRRARELRDRGYTVDTLLVPGRSAAEGVARVAEDVGADLIAITLRTHGLAGRVRVGSAARDLLQRTARPVLVCCEGSPGRREGDEHAVEGAREPAGAA